MCLFRSKFKDAIDYLDQIFEDLKKECDVATEDKNNNASQREEDPRRTASSIGEQEAAKRVDNENDRR
ncbi:hypothetical protein WR25_13170 [Diploscapter pachys]|uniref:Uncharacterized protein n=1 Tax=Diploscapter pachys TaxID=2018661 RepID=A0A2A2LKU3_9BILA|nr:hypothetical protein WR25_13170 [Diploscapter pachys]